MDGRGESSGKGAMDDRQVTAAVGTGAEHAAHDGRPRGGRCEVVYELKDTALVTGDKNSLQTVWRANSRDLRTSRDRHVPRGDRQ